MRLRITIAMLEIRNRKTLQSKVNICKSDVKIRDYADSLGTIVMKIELLLNRISLPKVVVVYQGSRSMHMENNTS